MVAIVTDGDCNTIFQAARDSSPDVILELVPLIGSIPGKDAIRAMGSLLDHPDSAVRLGVVSQLAKRYEPEAISVLIPCLDDKAVEVRLRALARLANMKQRAVIDRVTGMVGDASFYGRPIKEQIALIDVLGQWRLREAVEILERIVVRRGRLRGEGMGPLRTRAAMALGQIDNEAARRVLRKGARSWHTGIRRACHRALKGT
jgi:HEAT repeat protein